MPLIKSLCRWTHYSRSYLTSAWKLRLDRVFFLVIWKCWLIFVIGILTEDVDVNSLGSLPQQEGLPLCKMSQSVSSFGICNCLSDSWNCNCPDNDDSHVSGGFQINSGRVKRCIDKSFTVHLHWHDGQCRCTGIEFEWSFLYFFMLVSTRCIIQPFNHSRTLMSA